MSNDDPPPPSSSALRTRGRGGAGSGDAIPASAVLGAAAGDDRPEEEKPGRRRRRRRRRLLYLATTIPPIATFAAIGATYVFVPTVRRGALESGSGGAVRSSSSSSSSSSSLVRGGDFRPRADGDASVGPPGAERPAVGARGNTRTESGRGGGGGGGNDDGGGDDDRRRAPMSRIVYGTAWKGDRTASLVSVAVAAGFRHFDTANFPRDYDEAGVGEGWTRAVANDPSLRREDLFLQTKFTPVDFHKQDRTNLPYDGDADEAEQIRQSVEGSLRNLRTEYIDAVLLHSAMEPPDRLVEAWTMLESYVDEGKVRYLGISNVHDPEYFRRLHDRARTKPAIVQNRFHRNRGFDVPARLRPALRDLGVVSYQTFWTLTGNGPAWRKSEAVKAVADRYGLTPAQAIYAFAMTLGISPLSGTKDRTHMEQDLEVVRKFERGDVFRSSDGSGGGVDNRDGWNEEERNVIARALGMKGLV